MAPIHLTDDHRAAIRDFVAAHGKPVAFVPTDEFGQEVNPWGWTNHDAHRHILTTDCTWHIADGAEALEKTYHLSDPPSDDIGVNVGPAWCTCRAWTDQTLRVPGDLDDLIATPHPDPTRRIIL